LNRTFGAFEFEAELFLDDSKDRWVVRIGRRPVGPEWWRLIVIRRPHQRHVVIPGQSGRVEYLAGKDGRQRRCQTNKGSAFDNQWSRSIAPGTAALPF